MNQVPTYSVKIYRVPLGVLFWTFVCFTHSFVTIKCHYHLNSILDYNQRQLFLTLKIYFDQIYTLAFFEKKSDCLGVGIPAVNIFEKVSDIHPTHTMHFRERCLFP